MCILLLKVARNARRSAMTRFLFRLPTRSRNRTQHNAPVLVMSSLSSTSHTILSDLAHRHAYSPIPDLRHFR